jgi:outer membrane protein OmpU
MDAIADYIGPGGIAMKKQLLASSAIIGASLAAVPAVAADAIKLGVGGFFNEAYQAVFDDDGEGELGNEHNTDGFFNSAEVHFTGSTALDNGLTVGAHIELEGENDDDQIDEAWVSFSSGFGEARIGSIDDALAYACILPPGATENFSAFSPDQWGANTLISNPACVGVDESAGGDAQKILYFSPIFSGFQLAASYTPNGGDQNHTDVAGPHVGMPFNNDDESRHNFSVYATYTYEGDGWGVTWGGGGSWEGHVEKAPGPDRRKQQFYQTGLNFTFGNFDVGGAFEYYNHAFDRSNQDEFVEEVLIEDAWVAGGGIAYTMDAWIFGAQYSHLEADGAGAATFDDFSQDRAMVTAIYNLGPGIQLDGEVAYTWVDTDPEGAETSDGIEVDNYEALELGLGTAITF